MAITCKCECCSLKAKIARQLYQIAERMGADMDLLGALGSYGDTLPDEDILHLLTCINESFDDGDQHL